jgi:NADPH:quinone reductase
LFEFVAQPGYKVHVHKEYDFTAEGLQEAQKDITGRGTVGKLVVKIA